jgi:hypothetical protein
MHKRTRASSHVYIQSTAPPHKPRPCCPLPSIWTKREGGRRVLSSTGGLAHHLPGPCQSPSHPLLLPFNMPLNLCKVPREPRPLHSAIRARSQNVKCQPPPAPPAPPPPNHPPPSRAQAHAQLDFYVNSPYIENPFIDTAELYPVPPKRDTCGSTETMIGNWLAKGGPELRKKIILASKVAGRSSRTWITAKRSDPPGKEEDTR